MLTFLQSRAFQFALVVSLTAITASARADGLFSSDSLRSALGKTSSPSDSPGKQAAPGRAGSGAAVIGKGDLANLVRSAGFAIEKEQDGLLLISVTTKERTYSILVAFSTDESHIWLATPLRSLAKGSVLSTDLLANLLDANRRYGLFFFTFDKQTRRIELRRSLRNLNLDAETFKQHVSVLVGVADETASLWAADAATQSPAQNNTPGHVGRWTATTADGQSFVLELMADGSFILTHRKANSETSRSQGSYTLKEGRLELKVDSASVVRARVTFDSKDSFTFAVGSGSGLKFIRS